jgi:hypothetical protein
MRRAKETLDLTRAAHLSLPCSTTLAKPWLHAKSHVADAFWTKEALYG